MDSANQFQILEKSACSSLCTNALEKGKNSSLLQLAFGKYWVSQGFLALVQQPMYAEENFST